MSRSTTQIPNNVFTPNAVSVVTSTGFNQGDLVYQASSGNYERIPNTMTTTETFDMLQTSPILSQNSVSGSVQVANKTGTSWNQYADTLSNGNIVHVFSNNGIASFKITTVAGASVVAETVVSATYTLSYPSVSVAALSGGGFVVTWVNTNAGGTINSINYAVYTNTGSVTLSAAQDTSLTTVTNAPYSAYVLALPNGGFVLAGQNSSNQCMYRIYNASGTGLFAATTLSSYVPNLGLGMAARSDSSFIITGGIGGTTVVYTIISATNTTIVGTTSFSSSAMITAISLSSATCLVDGTTFVVGYIGTGGSINHAAFVTIPTGNVVSAETVVTNGISSSSSGNAFSSVTVKALSSGNFIFLCSEFNGLINYAVFNSSRVCVSGTAGTSSLPKRIWAGTVRAGAQYHTIIETASSINIYWTYTNSGLSSGLHGTIQSFVPLSLTTFDPVPLISSTNKVGTYSAAVNTYAIGSSTPSSAKFLASTTAYNATPVSMGFVKAGATIATSAASVIYSTTLTNGNFVIVYNNSATSPYPIYFNIYTPAGVLIQTTQVTATSVGTLQSAKIVALSGGGFVISYVTSSSNPTTIINNAYSSAGVLVGTSTIFSVISHNPSSRFSLAAITNDRFIITFTLTGTSTTWLQVFNNTATSLAAAVNLSIANIQYSSTAGYSTGGFALQHYTTSCIIVKYTENSTNVFTAGTSYTVNVAISNQASASQLCVSSNNVHHFITALNGPAFYMASSYDNAISYWPVSLYSPSLGNVTATQQEFNICVTAAGSTVFMVASSGVANIKVMSDMVNPNTSNITTQYNLTIADYSATTANLCVGLAPLYGDVVIMTYTTNTANLPAFALFNACPYNAGTVTTAGVTTSNGIALSPNMGYAFAGVASTTATANTVGQIQTNGVATLNSSYSASTTTQNFDAQNNTGVGVKGSITGRSVILQGNT